MDMAKLTRVHLRMRAAKSELTRTYEEAKAKLEADMATIEDAMLVTLRQSGVKSMASAAGTVYIEKKVMPNCTDWNAYHTWMAKTGSFEGLEKRVGKNFIVAYMRDNADKLPPGITTHTEDVVRVRVGNE